MLDRYLKDEAAVQRMRALLVGPHLDAFAAVLCALGRGQRFLHGVTNARPTAPVLRDLNAVLTPPHALAPGIPLVLHARYLGVELSAAFDHRTADGKFRDYYTGVEPTDGGLFDLLLVTLDKAARDERALALPGLPAQ
jgi:hypothetical protein